MKDKLYTTVEGLLNSDLWEYLRQGLINEGNDEYLAEFDRYDERLAAIVFSEVSYYR